MTVSRNGFSLIEVVVSLAIFMGMTLVFTGMISQMNGQLVGTTRKLETLELKNTLVNTLSSPSTCACLMSRYSNEFDSDQSSPQSEVSEIRSSCDPSADRIIAKDEAVPGAQTQLGIKNISVSDIRPTAISDQYQGNLKVDFVDDKRTILFKSIELAGFFTTDPATPNSAKKIETCVFGSASFNPNVIAGDVFGECEPGEYVTGIDANGFRCSPLPDRTVASNNGNSGGPYSPQNPGPGCRGADCQTDDYGPCEGSRCVTNGNYCRGTDCVATAPSASCEGSRCCAGRRCSRP